jgi:putative Mg2+ transporter-C (MgtC) family protein
MLQGFAANGLQLTELDSEDLPDSSRVEITAEVNAEGTSAAALEGIVGRLSLEPAVTAARWRVATGDTSFS